MSTRDLQQQMTDDDRVKFERGAALRASFPRPLRSALKRWRTGSW